jgi:hypothetical protein
MLLLGYFEDIVPLFFQRGYKRERERERERERGKVNVFVVRDWGMIIPTTVWYSL